MLKKLKKVAFLSLLTTLVGCATDSTSSVIDKKYEPNMKAANFNVQLGMAYLQQNDRTRSKQKLLLALKQAPKWPVAVDAMAYYLEMTGEPSEAEAYYKRAINLDPHSGSALNNYGTYLCRSKKYSQAEKYFLKAVDQPSYLNSGEAYENAGLCALNIPDMAKAEMYFKRAVMQDENRTTSFYELADITFKQGRAQEAKNYLANYLKLQPHDAQSLLLEAQIAKKLNDKDTMHKDGSMLANFYSNSEQYKQFLKMENA